MLPGRSARGTFLRVMLPDLWRLIIGNSTVEHLVLTQTEAKILIFTEH